MVESNNPDDVDQLTGLFTDTDYQQTLFTHANFTQTLKALKTSSTDYDLTG